jgi:hypothetical protein
LAPFEARTITWIPSLSVRIAEATFTSSSVTIDFACLKFPDGKIDFASAAQIKGELAISSG